MPELHHDKTTVDFYSHVLAEGFGGICFRLCNINRHVATMRTTFRAFRSTLPVDIRVVNKFLHLGVDDSGSCDWVWYLLFEFGIPVLVVFQQLDDQCAVVIIRLHYDLL